LSSFDQTTTL
jgi:hypothetical protein